MAASTGSRHRTGRIARLVAQTENKDTNVGESLVSRSFRTVNYWLAVAAHDPLPTFCKSGCMRRGRKWVISYITRTGQER